MLVGCGTATKPEETKAPVTENNETKEMAGIGSYTSVNAKDVTKDTDGSVEVSTTYAGLVMDGDVVKYLYLDTVDANTKFNDAGEVSEGTEIKTKKELGDDYNMKTYGNATAEWYEQAEAFEKWAVGKTLNEVMSVATVDNDGKKIVDDADLKTSVTIGVNDFLFAIENASKNLKEVNGVVYAGMGSVTTDSLKNATADTKGSIEDTTTFALVTLDGDKKIVSLEMDAAQASAPFDTEGKILEFNETVLTKGEKGADYGMLAASSIGKEWFEQTDALEAFATGKTVEEFEAMSTTTNDWGSTLVDDEDLKTSVTIGVQDFLKAVEVANNNVVELSK